MDKNIKTQAEKVFHGVGVKPSDALTIFYKQAILQQGFPFEIRIPNKKTRDTLTALESGDGEVFRGTGKEIVAHLLK
jgi:DNA-damage-inducible protein J